jgi:hypothetical protein
MDRIYKIKFDVTDEELDDLFMYFSDEDLDDVEELEAEAYFYFHEEGNYVCYLITTEVEMRTYVGVMDKNKINIYVKDFSDRILNSTVNLEDNLRHNIDKENCEDFEDFIICLNEWVLGKLDIDFVLDRISSVGIDNLTENEKYFLNSYKI